MRPLLALVVVASAAAMVALPARAGGESDPVDQMEAVVEHMEAYMDDVLNQLEAELAEADTPQEQWHAYMEAVGQIEYYRDTKLALIADIAGGDPELQQAMLLYQSMIDATAVEALATAAAIYENAGLPEATTTTLRRTTTTTRPRNTTTTRPRNSTTTTIAQTTTSTSTTAPPSTSPSTSVASSTSTTVAATIPSAPPTTAATVTSTTSTTLAPASQATTTTTSPPSLVAGGPGSDSGLSLAAIDAELSGEQIGELSGESVIIPPDASAQDSDSPTGLRSLAEFDMQAGLMDGALWTIEYLGPALPSPVAAPVISVVAVLEMVVRALLSGTQAFVGPTLVFGVYAGYRSLFSRWARRRRETAAV